MQSGWTRRRVPLAWVTSLLVVAAVAWGAGRATLAPAHVETAASGAETVEVVQGELGRSIAVPVVATWALTPLAQAPTGGAITTVEVDDGTMVEAGTSLFTLELRPTVIAAGTVPSFRDLSAGATGPDVRQLQDLLTSLGHLPAGSVDGEFGAATARAVKAWQGALGLPKSGIVLASDVVYTPSLPARVLLGEGVRPGAQVNAGDELVSVVSAAPTFAAHLADGQIQFVTQGSTIDVLTDDSTWHADVTEIVRNDETGATIANLEGPNGAPLCGDECADRVPLIPGGEGVGLSGELVVVPRQAGPQVPASAVLTDPEGGSYVLDEAGTRRDVSVVLAADGQIILDGVTPGDRVQLAPAP